MRRPAPITSPTMSFPQTRWRINEAAPQSRLPQRLRRAPPNSGDARKQRPNLHCRASLRNFTNTSHHDNRNPRATVNRDFGSLAVSAKSLLVSLCFSLVTRVSTERRRSSTQFFAVQRQSQEAAASAPIRREKKADQKVRLLYRVTFAAAIRTAPRSDRQH